MRLTFDEIKKKEINRAKVLLDELKVIEKENELTNIIYQTPEGSIISCSTNNPEEHKKLRKELGWKIIKSRKQRKNKK